MRLSRTITVLGTALVLATASVASARGSIQAVATLGDKNVEASTIEVGSEVFKVTSHTVLRDLEGNIVTLVELPVPDVSERVQDRVVQAARFKAMDLAGQHVLVWLTLIEPID